MALRYDKYIPELPEVDAPCGNPFNPSYAMDCNKGGFANARHDNLRNLEAALLSEVCKYVAIEPHLQPITGVEFDPRSANTDDEVLLQAREKCIFRY